MNNYFYFDSNERGYLMSGPSENQASANLKKILILSNYFPNGYCRFDNKGFPLETLLEKLGLCLNSSQLIWPGTICKQCSSHFPYLHKIPAGLMIYECGLCLL